MPYKSTSKSNNSIRTKSRRMFFVLEPELKNDLREIAHTNYVSEAQFVRESVRRNIMLYKKEVFNEER